MGSCSSKTGQAGGHSGSKANTDQDSSDYQYVDEHVSKANTDQDSSDYQYVDEHVSKMPEDMNYGTFEDLVAYLTSHTDWTDLARLRAIFSWIVSFHVHNIWPYKTSPTGSPMEYILKIKRSEASYGDLMNKVCQMAGIPCVKLRGKKKFSAEIIADGQSWNAVQLAGSWRFVDVDLACEVLIVGGNFNTGSWIAVEVDGQRVNEDGRRGVILHRLNEFYFLPDPHHLIWTHFPDETEWQLLKKPVTLKEFEEHYFVGDQFFGLGMHDVPATKINVKVETKDGEIDFVFGLPQTKSYSYRFRYKLYRSRSSENQIKLDKFVDRFVFFEHREDALRFALRFPVKGSFKLDIYGREVADMTSRFTLVCTYLINCPKEKINSLPLPDAPPIGWGPVPQTKEAGINPLTHKEAEVGTKDGYVEIRLRKEKALAFHQMLKHFVIDEATLSKYSVTEVDGDDVVVHLRLQKGEYALKLFAQDLEETGAAENVLNYLINSSNTDIKPFPNFTTGLLGRNEMNSKEFGVNALSHNGGMIDTKDGKLSIDFESKPGIELLCEIHTNDGVAASKMTKVITNDGNKWNFDLDMPVNGEYSLNVFARQMNDPEQIHNVHSYLIKSSGRENSVGAGTKKLDMSVPTETMETSDGKVMVPVPPGVGDAVAAVHRRTGNSYPHRNQIKFFSEDDKNLVRAELIGYGEHMLNVYSVDESGNQVKNVSKHQINRKLPERSVEEDSEEDKHKPATRGINDAMDRKDSRKLEESIQKFLDGGGDESDPLIKKAREQLKMLKARDALMQAIHQRDKAALDKAIAHAKTVNKKRELDSQIAKAAQLRERLVRIEKLRHAVLNMEAKTIAEVKNYANPPDGVHQCMMATFLLLGHQLKEVKDWQQIQVLMGKIGKESMMKKISEFDARTVPMKTAIAAKGTISAYSKNQIRDVSAGAATFYVWVKNVSKHQINRKLPERSVKEDSEEDKHKPATRGINDAMDRKNSRKLEEAIQKFLDGGGDESDPLIKKAREQLKMLKARNALMQAIHQRDKAALDKAIAHAKTVNKKRELDSQIAKAAQLRERLVKIEKLRHAVLNMEAKTIAEVKNYANPPDGVHQCMMATFLLLGHQLKEVKDWQQIQVLMGKIGKESMMKKISEFDARTVPMKTATAAKGTMSAYSKNQIRDVSAGAATFNVWAAGMIEEVETLGRAKQTNQMRLKK